MRLKIQEQNHIAQTQDGSLERLIIGQLKENTGGDLNKSTL